VADPSAGVPVYDPATRKLTYQTPEDAAPQVRSGRVQVPAGKVSIVRDNEVREIDPSKLGEAESFGWALVDDEGVRAARLRAEEDTFLGSVQGTAEAAASGLTFGLSDLAAVELGADPERMRARKRAAGDVGESARLAGEVLPVLFSGGTAAGVKAGAKGAAMGLGRRTIAKAGVLPRAVEAAGALAETGATRILGEGIAGRATGAAVRGAVEGAASGVGQEIHESALGGRDITAERLLAAGGMGALFGGGASAAFPLTGALLRRGTKAPREAVANVLGKATKSDPANVLGVADMVGAAVQGKPLSPTRQILSEMGKGKDARKLVNEVAHDLDGVTQKSAGVAKQATHDFAERMRGVVQKSEADRVENMRRLFEAADDEVVPDRVLRELDSLTGRLDRDGFSLFRDYGPGEISKRHLDTFQGELDRAFDDITRKGMNAADAHTRLLGVKRRARELARDVGRMDSKAQQTSKVLRNLEMQIGDALGAPEMGKAADAWREMSKADALALQSSDALFKTDRITGARKGKNLLGRVLNGEATDAEILTFTKRVGNPKYADQAELADDYFRRQIEAAELRAKHSADGGLTKEVAELRKGYDEFQRTMKQQAKVADIADAFRSAGRGSLPGVLSVFGPSGATVAGALLGGVGGAAIGGALNAAARPGSSLRTLAAVSHLADKAGVDVDGIISRAVNLDAKGAAKAVAGAAGRGARKAAEAVGRGAARGRGVASRVAGRAAVSRHEDQRAKQRRAEELADPDTLNRELARQMYALADAAPGIAGAAAEKIGVAAAFLASKLPPEIPDPITGSKRIIDPGTRESFDRYHEAVTDPVGTLARLEDGTMSLEHAEALRVVWPALYEDVQGKVFERLQEAADNGTPIPYTRRKALGVLFDLPTVPEMAPEYRQAVQALVGGEMEAKSAQKEAEANATDGSKPARKVALKSPKSYGTTLTRIERHDV
jgi:hypothetical protein